MLKQARRARGNAIALASVGWRGTRILLVCVLVLEPRVRWKCDEMSNVVDQEMKECGVEMTECACSRG